MDGVEIVERVCTKEITAQLPGHMQRSWREVRRRCRCKQGDVNI